ncbi:MAG: hypothetical protein ABI920_02495 [Casimicrobiaceae bacterium]
MTRLNRIRAALAAMSAQELHALRAAAEQTTGVACGLFAWLEHITGWEIDRREHQNYLLRFPTETMEPEEYPEALLALAALDLTFRHKGGSPEIDELLRASSELIRTCGPLH